jgi:RHS repeat-associated protein
MADSTGTYTVHSDHLQTPTVLSNSQGTTVWSMQHVAFGQAWINSYPDADGIAVEFNQRFPGQYYDQETGLNYNYFRDYDPAIGRYIQSDPIGLAGGMNVYGYVGNNPNSAIDPAGLDAYVIATPNGNGYSFYAHGSVQNGVISGAFNANTTNFNQVRPGVYSVTPRPVLSPSLNPFRDVNKKAGNPTISNTNDWNTIQYSDGSITQGAQFHPGRDGTDGGTSLACMVADQSTFDSLNSLFKANYNNGGVTLIVLPPGWMGP